MIGRPGVLGLPTQNPNALGARSRFDGPLLSLVLPPNLTVNRFLAAKGQRFLLEVVDGLVGD